MCRRISCTSASAIHTRQTRTSKSYCLMDVEKACGLMLTRLALFGKPMWLICGTEIEICHVWPLQLQRSYSRYRIYDATNKPHRW